MELSVSAVHSVAFFKHTLLSFNVLKLLVKAVSKSVCLKLFVRNLQALLVLLSLLFELLVKLFAALLNLSLLLSCLSRLLCL